MGAESITVSLCECGCGQTTPIAKYTDRRLHGYVKGQPCRFARGHKPSKPLSVNGYVTVYQRVGDEHWYSSAHRLAAERAIGHTLPVTAEVHHVDGNPRNNKNSNLVICQDAAYHRLLHVRADIVRAGGDPNTQRLCSQCHTLKAFHAFNKRPNHRSYGIRAACRECENRELVAYKRRIKSRSHAEVSS